MLSGLLLRLYGINFGLPFVYAYDERIPVNIAWKMFSSHDFNPHWFGWPGTTMIYMLSALYAFLYLMGRTFGVFESFADFDALYYQDPTVFFLSGRLMMAGFAVASIFITYLIARRLFNRQIALIAATFLAVSPLHVHHSKLIRPDILLTFFILLVVWFCLKIFDKKNWTGYILAGLFTGLAIATKYPAVIVALTIVVAHILSEPWRWISVKKLLVSGAASVLGFFIGSPFLFFSIGRVVNDVAKAAPSYSLGATGGGFIQQLVYYFQGPVIQSLTVGGLVFAGIGIILCIASRRKIQRLLIVFPIAFILFIASFSLRYTRYIIPVIPFLCIFSAYTCCWLGEKIGKRWKPWFGRLLCFFLVIGIVTPLVKADILRGQKLSLPDTRTIAHEWVLNNIPQGSKLLVEVYTPELPRERYTFFVVKNKELVEVDSQRILYARFRPLWRITGTLKDINAVRINNIEYMVISNIYDRRLRERKKNADSEKIAATYEVLMKMGDKIYEVKSKAGKRTGPAIRVFKFRSREKP